MFWILHVLLGMLIGAYFNSWILVIIFAFLSHFLLDFAPHWDGYFDKDKFEKKTKAVIPKSDVIIRGIDGIFAIITLFYCFKLSNYNSLVLLGGIFALMPDIIKIGYYTPLIKVKFYKNYLKFHSKIQHDAPLIIGLLIQLITGLVIYYFLIKII